jgi:predicted O-linked N-acetylglucosamine transferase (SPINDLY family)
MSYPERVVKAITRAKASISAGDFESAIGDLTKAIEKYAKAGEAWIVLGQAWGMLGEHATAEQALRKGLTMMPNHADAWFWLGLSLSQQKRFGEAIGAYEKSAKLNRGIPQPGVLHNAGACLINLDRFDDAIETYKLLLNIKDSPDAWGMLGVSYQGINQHKEALAAYQNAMQRGAGGYTITLNAGVCCYVLNDFESAIRYAEDALQASAGDEVASYNHMIALCAAGQIEEAFDRYQNSNNEQIAQARLLVQNYVYSNLPKNVRLAHEDYCNKFVFGANLPGAKLSASEKIRIGFVSGDFRKHPVAFFLMGLLKALGRETVEVFMYSTNQDSDSITDQFIAIEQSIWVKLGGMPISQMVERIRSDSLHVAVDISGFTSTSVGPEIIAAGVAPAHASYLGYGATTGLKNNHYFFSDTLLDPVGLTESHYSETLVHLGDCFATFSPLSEDVPIIGPLPLLRNGHPTFGVFSQLIKITDESICLWADAMNRVPEAILKITAPGLEYPLAQERLMSRLTSKGIGAHRIAMSGEIPMEAYLAAHNEVDVLLDTIPWNAHTTAMHALWMGVPTISVRGDRHISRFGEMVLRNAGLGKMLAEEKDQYGDLVSKIVADSQALANIRNTARDLLGVSPLSDHAALAKNFEAACRFVYEASNQITNQTNIGMPLPIPLLND